MQIIVQKGRTLQKLKKWFCQNNKNLSEKPTEQQVYFSEKKKTPESKEPYSYAKEKFDLVNSKSFIDKLEKIELQG